MNVVCGLGNENADFLSGLFRVFSFGLIRSLGSSYCCPLYCKLHLIAQAHVNQKRRKNPPLQKTFVFEIISLAQQ